jgi:hypothetical protein
MTTEEVPHWEEEGLAAVEAISGGGAQCGSVRRSECGSSRMGEKWSKKKLGAHLLGQQMWIVGGEK